jgi:RNA polymerase sigma factor (sigma-70 family)
MALKKIRANPIKTGPHRWTEMRLQKSESELLDMYCKGCNDSLAIIYTNYWRLFKSVSKKYLCNDDSEDLIHSVIEKLLLMPVEKRMLQFSNVRSIKSFFYVLIKNASLDYLRKRKLDCVGIEYATHSPEERNDNSYLALEYENVGLSEMEMKLFEEYINGLKPKAIASQHRKSISTVKNTLNNAKRKILRYYKEKAYLLE